MSQEALSELEAITGAGTVTERSVIDLWPLGLMRRRAGQSSPVVRVVRPSMSAQVPGLLAWATAKGITLVPMGAGSGVCGAIGLQGGEIALDLGGLNRVLNIDSTNHTCRVEAGVLGIDLEVALQAHGLTWGHFPSSLPTSTVGGLISTRSTGQESTRYGSVEDSVLGLRIALADGRLLEPRPFGRSAVGPALDQLWIGAEGSLGVILEATLRVHPPPTLVLGGGWELSSIGAGLQAMRSVLRTGIRPLVMRLYDREDTAFQGLDLDGCLLVAASAGEPSVAQAEFAVIRDALASATDLGPEPWERWQRHRFDLSADRLRGYLEPTGAFLDTIELGGPWDVMEGLHQQVKSGLSAHGIALCHFSHPTLQGCCAYFTFGGSRDTEEEAERVYLACWRETMARALEAGATISHHHGVGRARRDWVKTELGGWWGVWDSVRASLDPLGTLNPNAVGGRGDKGAKNSLEDNLE